MNNKLKYACGISFYNPTNEMVERAIAYKNVFDKVIVFDNSDGVKISSISKIKNDDEIIYISENRNCGLPYAYNYILDNYIYEHYEWFCTLDQDSKFSLEEVQNLKLYIDRNQEELLEKVGIIAPYINYNKDSFKKSMEIKECKWVITSGAFLNVKLMKQYHLKYDENYFIDKFEIDLCKQITNAGLKIYMYLGAELKQKLGEKNKHNYSEHSPLRHRYLFRNRFYFNNKYYKLPKRWIWNILQSGRHLLGILLYEGKKLEKIKAFIRACKDYLRGNIGEIIE